MAVKWFEIVATFIQLTITLLTWGPCRIINNSEKIMFFSTTEQGDANFPYVVGKEINYEIKPNGNGKLIREDNFTKGFNQMPNAKVNTNGAK